MKKLHILILAGLTLLLSCNVHFEKRLYRKGYYVDIVSKHNTPFGGQKHLAKNNHEVDENTEEPGYSVLNDKIDIPTLSNPVAISAPEEIEVALNTGELQNEEMVFEQKNPAIRSFNKLDVIPKEESHLTINKSLSVHEEKSGSRGDILLYLTVGLIALTSIAIMKARPKRVIKITRWAKANPTKNKWLIAAMQVPMVILTVWSGYNLKQLGYELSDAIYYVSGAMILLGLLTTPLIPKRNPIAIPRTVNRRRMIYLGMTLASAMIAVGFGNQIEQRYPSSPIVSIIKAVDQSVFSETHEKPSDVTEPDAKTCKCKTSRKVGGVAAAIGCGLVAFYTFLLICFGVGGGVALVATGAVFAYLGWGVALIIAGLGILALVIWLFYKLFKVPCRKREKKEKVKRNT